MALNFRGATQGGGFVRSSLDSLIGSGAAGLALKFVRRNPAVAIGLGVLAAGATLLGGRAGRNMGRVDHTKSRRVSRPGKRQRA